MTLHVLYSYMCSTVWPFAIWLFIGLATKVKVHHPNHQER